MSTHYAVLGIESTATHIDIKRAFHKIARSHHPDRNPNGDVELFKKAVEAHEVLSDSSKRREYDQKLRRADTASQFSGSDPFGGDSSASYFADQFNARSNDNSRNYRSTRSNPFASFFTKASFTSKPSTSSTRAREFFESEPGRDTFEFFDLNHSPPPSNRFKFFGFTTSPLDDEFDGFFPSMASDIHVTASFAQRPRRSWLHETQERQKPRSKRNKQPSHVTEPDFHLSEDSSEHDFGFSSKYFMDEAIPKVKRRKKSKLRKQSSKTSGLFSNPFSNDTEDSTLSQDTEDDGLRKRASKREKSKKFKKKEPEVVVDLTSDNNEEYSEDLTNEQAVQNDVPNPTNAAPSENLKENIPRDDTQPPVNNVVPETDAAVSADTPADPSNAVPADPADPVAANLTTEPPSSTHNTESHIQSEQQSTNRSPSGTKRHTELPESPSKRRNPFSLREMFNVSPFTQTHGESFNFAGISSELRNNDHRIRQYNRPIRTNQSTGEPAAQPAQSNKRTQDSGVNPLQIHDSAVLREYTDESAGMYETLANLHAERQRMLIEQTSSGSPPMAESWARNLDATYGILNRLTQGTQRSTNIAFGLDDGSK